MKRKRAHDEKAILKHEKKDQPLPAIHDDDEQMKTLEVRVISMNCSVFVIYRWII